MDTPKLDAMPSSKQQQQRDMFACSAALSTVTDLHYALFCAFEHCWKGVSYNWGRQPPSSVSSSERTLATQLLLTLRRSVFASDTALCLSYRAGSNNSHLDIPAVSWPVSETNRQTTVELETKLRAVPLTT